MAQEPHREIARLEERIERLSSVASRCRKVDLAARIIMTAGGAWFVAALFGLLRADAVSVLAALSGLIFGVVLYGSNRRTWNDAEAEIAALADRRTRLIDAIDPIVVQERG